MNLHEKRCLRRVGYELQSVARSTVPQVRVRSLDANLGHTTPMQLLLTFWRAIRPLLRTPRLLLRSNLFQALTGDINKL